MTHKVETHNSPSALDPFGGSITGIVGVNRDTIGFGLGAKPIANTFGFCLGYPEEKRVLYRDKELKQKMLSTDRIMEGVIKGVNSGGNCSGIPTISGFVRFDERFRAKPLVFVGTIGLIPNKINTKSSVEKSAKKGDYIVVTGGRVGLDGIHGATFSSVIMDSNSPATAVQIGDPITQKKMSDAIVKIARDLHLYNSITDNGAGGISCSVAEMARECGGAIVDLEKVPLKYANLESWQIWISESQERMTLAVPKNK
ncbi:MAG: AIR synthase-related protein [Cyanobium sp. MAG06]|nr:AIR synthase-related protein [Cyanobium sp. MAG06]